MCDFHNFCSSARSIDTLGYMSTYFWLVYLSNEEDYRVIVQILMRSLSRQCYPERAHSNLENVPVVQSI